MVPSYRGSSFLDPKVLHSSAYLCSCAHSGTWPTCHGKTTNLSSCLLMQWLCLLSSHNDPSWHIQSLVETLVRLAEHHAEADHI